MYVKNISKKTNISLPNYKSTLFIDGVSHIDVNLDLEYLIWTIHLFACSCFNKKTADLKYIPVTKLAVSLCMYFCIFLYLHFILKFIYNLINDIYQLDVCMAIWLSSPLDF